MWFLGKQITEPAKNEKPQQGIAVPWVSNKSPRVATSSFEWGDTSSVLWLRQGQDVERPIRWIGIWEYRGVPTYVRCDNSTVAYQVDSPNTVTNGGV